MEEEQCHFREEEERIRLAKEENERQMKNHIRLLEDEEKRIKLGLELKGQVEEDERKGRTNSPTERRIRTTKERGGI